MNILSGRIAQSGTQTRVALGERNIDVPLPSSEKLQGQTISLGVRPEDLHLADGENYLFSGTVHFVEQLGEVTNVYLQVEGAEDTVVIKIGGVQNFDKGQTVRVSAAPDKLHLFNSEGRSLLYI